MKNNFDLSSTGINIEASAFYDSWLSRDQFSENFEIIRHSGNRKHSILYYINYGHVKGANDIEFTLQGEKSDKVKLLQEEGFTHDDINQWDDATLQSEVFGQLSERPNLANFETLNEYDLKDSGLEIKPSKELVKVISRGYSQGDYSEIYYAPDDLREAWGNDVNEKDLKQEFDNLLWDAPIYASVTINDTEYLYHECPAYDAYEFKRDAFIAWIAEQSKIDAKSILMALNFFTNIN